MRLKSRPSLPSSAYSRWLFLGLMTLLLLATALTRLAQLTELPTGMHPDIGYYLSDALRISRTFPDGLFLDDRPEPFWRLYLAALMKLLDTPSFTPIFAGMIIGMLTVALTYRAMLELLRLLRWSSADARYVGALVAAGAVAANMVLLFLNREGYRAALVPLSIAFMIFAWARAWRKGEGWLLAGVAAGLPVNTYISGLLAPVAGLGTLLIFMLIGRPSAARPHLRQVAMLLLGMGLACAPQGILLLDNPAAYARVSEIDANQGTPDLTARITDFWSDFATSLRAFYGTGNYRPNYNTPDTAFLNPALAVLALIGAGVLLINRASLPPLLILILLSVMTLPGTFSDEPDHPFRLVGTFVPLAALAGVGIVGLGDALRYFPPRWQFFTWLGQRVLALGAIGIVFISVGFTWNRYTQHFSDERYLPQDYNWLSFAHYYSVTWNEFLAELQTIERPTYVPVARLDTSLSAWHLRASAFPTVTTLTSAEFDASTLPAGDLWYPYRAEYSVPIELVNTPPEQFALLIPGENGRGGSITILPPMSAGTAQTLYDRVQSEGTPMAASNGWLMGWQLGDIDPTTLTHVPTEWHPSGARFADDALELIGYDAPHDIQPDTPWRVTLYWRVLQPIHYDVFNIISLVNTNLAAIETQEHWLYRWIYPAVFWEVGSVVPQVVTFNPPPEMPATAYALGISLHTQPNHRPVTGTDSAGTPLPDNWLLHQNHRVAQAPVTPPAESQLAEPVVFGDALRLTAIEAEPLEAGKTSQLKLYWDVTERPRGNYIQLLHIRDANGAYIVQDTTPFNGTYPTNIWYAGDSLMTPYTLTLPADAQAPYTFMLGWYEYPSMQRLAATQGTLTLPDNLFIPEN